MTTWNRNKGYIRSHCGKHEIYKLKENKWQLFTDGRDMGIYSKQIYAKNKC